MDNRIVAFPCPHSDRCRMIAKYPASGELRKGLRRARARGEESQAGFWHLPVPGPDCVDGPRRSGDIRADVDLHVFGFQPDRTSERVACFDCLHACRAAHGELRKIFLDSRGGRLLHVELRTSNLHLLRKYSARVPAKSVAKRHHFLPEHDATADDSLSRPQKGIRPETVAAHFRRLAGGHTDGRRLSFHLTNKAPYRDANEKVVGLIGEVRNITEQKQIEEHLRQSQKMEAIGTLAGGVAHDFNNLLMVISGYSSVLSDALANDAKLRGHVDQVQKASERAASLTRQLLAFSRKQTIQPSALKLNQTITGMEKLLHRLIG